MCSGFTEVWIGLEGGSWAELVGVACMCGTVCCCWMSTGGGGGDAAREGGTFSTGVDEVVSEAQDCGEEALVEPGEEAVA